MERVTPPGSWADAHDGQGPIDSPETADDVVARSEVLKRLERLAPDVVVGPLDRSSQLWIGQSRHPDGQTRVARPTPSLLVEPSEEHPGKARAKPFGLGLFSSTGAFDGWSMWRVYLELNRGSTLFPEPWHVWKLEGRAIRPFLRSRAHATGSISSRLTHGECAACSTRTGSGLLHLVDEVSGEEDQEISVSRRSTASGSCA
jgi:hypothetical protein